MHYKLPTPSHIPLSLGSKTLIIKSKLTILTATDKGSSESVVSLIEKR
jgi:hypothetical protein